MPLKIPLHLKFVAKLPCKCHGLKSNYWKQLDHFCNSTYTVFLRVRRPAAERTHWTFDVRTGRRSQYASYDTGVAVVKVLRQRYVLA